MIAIVCNPKAGKGKALTMLHAIQVSLDRQMLSYSVFDNNWPKDFKGFDALWLIGGDGTLNHFINQYPGIEIPIALFKGGSGNDFAWKLYDELGFEKYIELVLHGNPKMVDLGTCNNRYFINGVGIGFDAEVVRAMGQKRFLPGHFAYLFAVIRKILFYREIDMMIESRNFRHSGKVFMVSIANGSRYGGGFQVAPQALVNDGELDIVIIKPIPSLIRFFHLPKVSKGSHLKLPFIEVFREKKIIIYGKSKLNAHLDGELIQSDSFDIQIAPWKLLFYC